MGFDVGHERTGFHADEAGSLWHAARSNIGQLAHGAKFSRTLWCALPHHSPRRFTRYFVERAAIQGQLRLTLESALDRYSQQSVGRASFSAHWCRWHQQHRTLPSVGRSAFAIQWSLGLPNLAASPCITRSVAQRCHGLVAGATFACGALPRARWRVVEYGGVGRVKRHTR